MMLKCIQARGRLGEFFTEGKRYPFKAHDKIEDRIHVLDDDKETCKNDNLPWVFWIMPNGKVAAYMQKPLDENTLFEIEVDYEN